MVPASIRSRWRHLPIVLLASMFILPTIGDSIKYPNLGYYFDNRLFLGGKSEGDWIVESKNKKTVGIALSIVFVASLLLGLFSLVTAYDKKDRYYNSESLTSLNENAYVGGDAYNYIINGTHFTGYMVQGMGFLVISTMTGMGALYCLLGNRRNPVTEKAEDLPAI